MSPSMQAPVSNSMMCSLAACPTCSPAMGWSYWGDTGECGEGSGVYRAGAASVGRAAQEKSMAGAMRLDAVVVRGTVNASELDEMRRARAGINPTQRIGGRLFILRDSTWTDLGHGDSLRVVSIAPYSDAYFALLKALPDLREAAALEPAVLVAGRRASIKIETGGKTRWNPGELERLVRDFRG